MPMVLLAINNVNPDVSSSPRSIAVIFASIHTVYLSFLRARLTAPESPTMDLSTVWALFSSLCAILTLVSLSFYLVPILYLSLIARPQDLRKKYCTPSANWAVVTGGSSGIGKALTKRLAKQGINVCMVALDDAMLRTTHREFQQQFPSVSFRAIGVNLGTDPEAYMKHVMEATEDIRVSILFNNAGYLLMGFFDDRPIEQHVANMECNAISAMRLTHLFYRRMAEQGIKGCISFTSSAVMFMPSPFALVYGGSKAMLTQFGMSLALEADSRGIDVTVFHPSYTHSNFYADTPKLGVLKVLAKFGWTPEDVADVVFRSVGRVIVRDFGAYAISTNIIGRMFDAGFLAKSSLPFVESMAPPGSIEGGKRK